MTDKELISIVDAKAKKLWNEINTGHEYSIIDSYNQFYGICMEIAEMVQEEPVSEDLEEAAVEAFKKIVDSDKNSFLEIFKAGAEWQKKKTLENAVDGIITFDYYSNDDKEYGCIAHDSFCLEDMDLKDRDKVKIAIIK